MKASSLRRLASASVRLPAALGGCRVRAGTGRAGSGAVQTSQPCPRHHRHPAGGPPALDRLTERGALFENAVTQTPLTPPAHASVFTGLNPNVHHVRNTGGFVLQSSLTTMAEILQQQGWDTAVFIGASVLKKLFGFNQGFAGLRRPDAQAGRRGADPGVPERRAEEVVDRALAWLNAQSGKPYLRWVHVFDPYLPYEPPAPFDRTCKGREYDGEGNALVAVMADHGVSAMQ
jgi:hypothetical protein